jgi:peptidoglycan/LPS O-acetylase OafA/YrhL
MSVSVVVPAGLYPASMLFYHIRVSVVEGAKVRRVTSSLSPVRRGIVAGIVVALVAAIIASVHEGTVASNWSNALGALLGCLAGTYVGERLPGAQERVTATRVVWVQMATIGLFIVAAVEFQSLPAYCQLPVVFLMGIAVVAATVYIRRLRIGGPT